MGGTATLGGLVDVDFYGAYGASDVEIGDYFDILTADGGITNADLGGVAFDFSDATLATPATFWKAEIFALGGGVEALRLSIGVPEPTSVLLLVLGGLCLAACRWRRRK